MKHEQRWNAIVRLALAGLLSMPVLGGMARAAGQSGDAQLDPGLRSTLTKITRAKEDVKRAATKASELSRQAEQAARERSAWEQRLRTAEAKLKSAQDAKPEPGSAGAGVKPADVLKLEANAKQAKDDADKMARRLAELAAAHADKERRLKAALATAQPAEAPVQINRSRADLEEELARAAKLRQEAEKKRQELEKQLKEINDQIGQTDKPLALDSGRAANTKASQLQQTVEFVCRNGQIAFLDNQPMFDRFIAEAKDLVKTNPQATYSDLKDRVNGLSLSTDNFTLRVDGPYQRKSDSQIFLELVTEPKAGPGWEDAGRLTATDSVFAKKLANLDPKTTGIYFVVWNDSFDTYRIAAAMAKRAGFRTRWEPYAEDESLFATFPSGSGSGGSGADWEQSGG